MPLPHYVRTSHGVSAETVANDSSVAVAVGRDVDAMDAVVVGEPS